MRIEVPLVGPQATQKSKFFNAQRTVNFYPITDQSSTHPHALQGWPGCKLLSTISGVGCGQTVWQGKLYAVHQNTFYSVTIGGVATSIGSIDGSGPCCFAASATQLVITRSGAAYVYDGSTLSKVEDTDLGTPDFCTYINAQFVYDVSSTLFGVSSAGDASTISALDTAEPETYGDRLTRPYAFRQQLYLFGNVSTETWYNSGQGRPPFDRITSIPIGCKYPQSISSNGNYIYFLASDRTVNRITSHQYQRVDTDAIASQLAGVNPSDAWGHCFTYAGQQFYSLYFPGSWKQFIYSETTNSWFELTPFATAPVRAYDKLLVQGVNGNVYEWDPDTYTNNGSAIIRLRDGIHVHSGLLQKPGKQLFYSGIELELSAGNGIATGQGSNPMVMFQFSDDAGHTWSNELWIASGVGGDYKHRAQLIAPLGCATNRVFRFRMSDPVNWTLLKLYVDVEVGV